MSLDHFGADLSIKVVDRRQRIISGLAAAHSNVDRVADIIDPSASVKAVARLTSPSDVAVFIGHQTSTLPVGIPQKIEATPEGLYTETYILKGPVGDNLLDVADDLLAHGQKLGMSIGYVPMDSKPERTSGKLVRRLMDYGLKEYSYAASQVIANPLALTTGVKAAGGAMQMRVEQGSDGKYHVMQGSESMGSYDTEAAAKAAMQMMMDRMGKTAGDDADVKAEWSQAQQNDLPDSAFLFIEPGGQKDEGGKTVPRSNRHFPYKGPDGSVDLPHLRNALARIPQAGSWLSSDQKSRLMARARTLLENANSGKLLDPSNDWTDGTPLTLKWLGYSLLDLAGELAEQHRAMKLLGESTKADCKMSADTLTSAKEIAARLGQVIEHAELIAAGRDEEALADWWRAQFELLEVAS